MTHKKMPTKLTSFLGNTTGVKDVRFQENMYFEWKPRTCREVTLFSI